MKLHTKTKYGIMALLHLASQHAPVSIQAVCTAQAIPVKYLEAIFASLRKANLITSEKGRNGGYQLAVKADELSLYEILLALDQTIFDTPQQEHDALGEFLNHTLWKPATESIIRYFKAVTLDDLNEETVDTVMYYI